MSAAATAKVERSEAWKGLNRRIRAWLRAAGIDEDADQRDLFERVTGHNSLGDCSEEQLRQICAELRALDPAIGGTPAPSARRETGKQRGPKRAGSRKLAEGPQASKARALWLALYHLGAVRDPAERALDAFVQRQTGVASLAWVGPEAMNSAIEALKDWCAREGFDPANHVPAMRPEPGTSVHGLKARLAAALWLRLHPDEAAAFRGLAKFVGTLHDRDLGHLSGARLDELDRAIEALGALVRKAKEGGGAMSERNLFGELESAPALSDAGRKRRQRRLRERPRGHAMPPGTGPDGETCRTCRHSTRVELATKGVHKCGANRARWSASVVTDIRLRDPACAKWEARD
jgi:phage gp16-like protein